MVASILDNSRPTSIEDPVLAAIFHLLRDKPELLIRIRAVLESNSEEPTDDKDDGPIRMQITPPIQRNYEQRGVFPQFRPERASKILPSMAAVFFVTTEQAEEVLQDAKEQRTRSDTPRGTPAALTCLCATLERAIKDEKFRGCIEFPGVEKVVAEHRAASVILEVGDRVAIWNDVGEFDELATIIKPYSTHIVDVADGPYVHHGERVRCCPGYVIKCDDGGEFFSRAGNLAPIGKIYGHLRLVRSS